ncbi:short chain dehydrogenase [Schizothecium vesticola]|uniref:Short chain dehydrogenase n=1 Tax=Schizothecium vesticola TaxID=314040 RepID=A0AA40ERB3_9PEZI|nr:short chain dehydrogenase [Schizothecium vesticola]
MLASNKLYILITGCSPGGMGAALAIQFHNAGHHVFATARDPSKLLELSKHGIETLTLDVTSSSSITSAVSSVSSSLPPGKGLNMLINNAGGIYAMPVVDTSIDAAKNSFDVNFWSQLATTQAFLPLVLSAVASKSGPAQAIVVNHSSVVSEIAFPFMGIYNASKAALGMLTETMRLELNPFGIRVVELKTAGVKTNIISSSNANACSDRLPDSSIFEPARKAVEMAMRQESLLEIGISPEQWASEVAALLLRRNPPSIIRRGGGAFLFRVAAALPRRFFEGTLKKMTKLDVVEKMIKAGASPE